MKVLDPQASWTRLGDLRDASCHFAKTWWGFYSTSTCPRSNLDDIRTGGEVASSNSLLLRNNGAHFVPGGCASLCSSLKQQPSYFFFLLLVHPSVFQKKIVANHMSSHPLCGFMGRSIYMHVYPLAASRPGGCIVFDTRQQRTVTDMSKLVYVPSPALSRSSSILGRWAIWHVVTAFSGLVHSEQSFLHHSVFFFFPFALMA